MTTEPSAPPVPLADLLAALESAGVPARLEGNAITVQHPQYLARAEVVAPAEAAAVPGREIRAVVRITCGMPEGMARQLSTEATALVANRLNTFGALTLDEGYGFVGSRLTIFEREAHAWHTLHLPLLLYALMVGAEPILGGVRRQMAGENAEGGASAWSLLDYPALQADLAPLAECAVEGATLNAEFPLAPARGEDGDLPRSALLQVMFDKPHPELGGGLLCVLQLPHRVEELARVCNILNAREMAAGDQPPHFGAWCAGTLGDNPAYVMFLPNALRDVEGIAINAAHWAIHRARWADSLLVATPGQAQPQQ